MKNLMLLLTLFWLAGCSSDTVKSGSNNAGPGDLGHDAVTDMSDLQVTDGSHARDTAGDQDVTCEPGGSNICCYTDADCPGDRNFYAWRNPDATYCFEGECIECQTDAECGWDAECNRNICERTRGGPCTSNDDCSFAEAGLPYISWQCNPGGFCARCDEDSQCDEGEICLKIGESYANCVLPEDVAPNCLTGRCVGRCEFGLDGIICSGKDPGDGDMD